MRSWGSALGAAAAHPSPGTSCGPAFTRAWRILPAASPKRLLQTPFFGEEEQEEEEGDDEEQQEATEQEEVAEISLASYNGGERYLPSPASSQRWMKGRSYVWPVATMTGSTMSSMDTGHWKCDGTDRPGSFPALQEGQ